MSRDAKVLIVALALLFVVGAGSVFFALQDNVGKGPAVGADLGE